jgi:signal transduction histidine kinase
MMIAVGGLIALTVWAEYQDHGAGGWFALDAASGVVSWALLPLLWRWPVAATAVLDVLAVLSSAATPAATFGTLRVAQRREVTTAATVGVLGISAHAVRGLLRPVPALPYAWWVVFMVIAHAALVGWGALHRFRAALLASLRERAMAAEAEQGRRVAEARAQERASIAREMHEVLAHRLSLLTTYAGALEYRPDAPAERLSKVAGVIRAGLHQALVELREVLTVLRDGEADDGLQRPQPVVADLPMLLEEVTESGTPVELTDRLVAAQTLPAMVSRTVYRVVQEGLTNARKHAPGQRVHITLTGAPGDELTIEMRNRIQESAVTTIPGSGTGLVGLTERVRLAGGRLDHQVTAQEFLLRAWLPFPDGPDHGRDPPGRGRGADALSADHPPAFLATMRAASARISSSVGGCSSSASAVAR